MPRTKTNPRKSAGGHTLREISKTNQEAKPQQIQDTRKKKREKRKAGKNGALPQTPQSPPPPPNTDAMEITNAELIDESMEVDQTTKSNTGFIESASWINTSFLADLSKTHELTTIHMISSSQIHKKVTRVLEVLSTFPAEPPAKSPVVMLYTKAKTASKMISVVEIVKREIAQKEGKWFQYNCVDSILEERMEAEKRGKGEKGGLDDTTAENEEEEGEEAEEAFETMKTPFERAIEGQKKVKATPTMTIYLSRIRIDGLKKDFTEQTNGKDI